MEQERTIVLMKTVITLPRTCRALCSSISAFTHGVLFDHQQPSAWAGLAIFIFIWQGRKSQCREVQERAKPHTVGQWQASYPVLPTFLRLYYFHGHLENIVEMAFSCLCPLFLSSSLQNENFKVQKYLKENGHPDVTGYNPDITRDNWTLWLCFQ